MDAANMSRPSAEDQKHVAALSDDLENNTMKNHFDAHTLAFLEEAEAEVASKEFDSLGWFGFLNYFWSGIIVSLLLIGAITTAIQNETSWKYASWFFLSLSFLGGPFGVIWQSLSNLFLTSVKVLTWQPVLYTAFFWLGFFEPVRDVVLERLEYFTERPWFLLFLVLFLFKFIKVVVHLISYLIYRPVSLPEKPKFTSQDVTVVIPTVGNFRCQEFLSSWMLCLVSILVNNPRRLVISVVGEEARDLAASVCIKIYQDHQKILKDIFANVTTELMIVSGPEANKRQQCIDAIIGADTKIISFADDHVYWPPTYLKNSVANFEDGHVGLVGTNKRVRRMKGENFLENLLNYIAVLYLERHNFEFTASNNLDGGVSVISGRTMLARTEVLQDPHFQHEYLNETWAFGFIGPMKVDDDNCVTRYMTNAGYKIVFHNSEEACVSTILGIKGYSMFCNQLMRWARTTWRSNTTTLLVDRTCWGRHPWTTYASFMSSFVNLAIIYDPALFYTLYRAGQPFDGAYYVLAFALFISKIIKPFPHLLRYPGDFWLLPFGIAFGYLHSLIRIWALLTCWSIEWSGRQGIKATGKTSDKPTDKTTKVPAPPAPGK